MSLKLFLPASLRILKIITCFITTDLTKIEYLESSLYAISFYKLSININSDCDLYLLSSIQKIFKNFSSTCSWELLLSFSFNVIYIYFLIIMIVIAWTNLKYLGQFKFYIYSFSILTIADYTAVVIMNSS